MSSHNFSQKTNGRICFSALTVLCSSCFQDCTEIFFFSLQSNFDLQFPKCSKINFHHSYYETLKFFQYNAVYLPRPEKCGKNLSQGGGGVAFLEDRFLTMLKYVPAALTYSYSSCCTYLLGYSIFLWRSKKRIKKHKSSNDRSFLAELVLLCGTYLLSYSIFFNIR